MDGVLSVTGEESTVSQEPFPGKGETTLVLADPRVAKHGTRTARARCMPGKWSVRAESTPVNTGEAASPIFGSPVHGTVTPCSAFLAARARDTMNKERETARLATLVNLNIQKYTAADTNAETFREEREKKRKEDTKAETLQKLLGSTLTSQTTRTWTMGEPSAGAER